MEEGSSHQQVRPYGSWPTPLSAERLVRGALRLASPQIDQGFVYWLEGRPAEGGRQAVVRARPGVAPADLTPADQNVRALVHEYGGGEFRVRGGRLVHTDMDQRVWLRDVEAPADAQLLGAGARWADFAFSPDSRWIAAVEERHFGGGREPENRLALFRLGGSAGPIPAAEGHDFVSSPRFSPDGRRLVFTAWEHPNMPWDGTRLFEIPFGPEGPRGPARHVAGGDDESIFQPGFSPGGALTFTSDRSGWWNLVRERPGGGFERPCPLDAEFGKPQWTLGMSTWAYLGEDAILCSVGSGGRDRLCRLELASGKLVDLGLPYTNAVGVEVEGDTACFAAGAPDRPMSIVRLDLASGRASELRASLDVALAPGSLSLPEAIEFPTSGGRTAHALFYPPRNPDFTGSARERPPLLVKSHGGPTSAALPVLDLRVQYWTSRGFAVVDVDYGGSSGYGRAYRERLREAWGIVDVEDCVNAARHLASSGRVDPDRMAISGGSAGGFTTLCALTFHDVFRAGASHYGIGDLEALRRDTHKFESRYLESLVGPWPETAERYRARSPIHHADRISCPVIFFQGLEDRVVPPSQSEAMAEALERRGLRCAYVAFPGEQHGFRRAENIRTALEGELYFYAQIFGFETDVRPAAVRISEGSAPR